MSTKTTFKRVALVAVAALGFGLLSVVPSSAATIGVYTPTLTSGTTTLAGTPTAATVSSTIGTAVNFNLVVTGSVTPTAADTAVSTPVLSGSATTTKLTVASLVAGANTLTNMTSSNASNVVTDTVTATGAASATHNFSFTPDAAGTFVFTWTTVGSTAPTAVLTITASPFVGGLYASNDSTGNLSSNTTANGVAGANNYVTLIQTAATNTAYNVVVTGSTATVVTASTPTTTGSGTSSIVTPINTAITMTIPTTTGGTITAKSYPITNGVQSATSTSTVTITVAGPPAALNPVVSTAKIGATNTTGTYPLAANTAYPAADDDVLAKAEIASASAAGFAKAVIKVSLKDINGLGITGTLPAVGASITGPGTLSIDIVANNLASAGRYLTLSAAPANVYYVNVFSDGTPGVATISLLVGGAVWKTKTVTFYGAPTKLVASQNHQVLKAGTTTGAGCNPTTCPGTSVANSYVVQVLATDALGNPVPGLAYTAIPDATVISGSAATSTNDGDADAAGATWFSVSTLTDAASGKTGTVSYKTPLSTTTNLTSNALTFAIGGGPVSVSVALGASANSELGAKNSLVFTDKDAAGNAPYDLDVPLALTSNIALVVCSGTSCTNGLPTTIIMIGGKGSVTFYNPLVQGNVTISGKAAGLLPVTVTFPVTSAVAQSITDAINASADAAAEATDAANAATDAANAAAEAADAATAAAQDASDAVAALSAQVAILIAGLKAQLTALTNLIIKIQKKLKA